MSRPDDGKADNVADTQVGQPVAVQDNSRASIGERPDEFERHERTGPAKFHSCDAGDAALATLLCRLQDDLLGAKDD
ncbi:MAG: hypothetical protein RJB09_1828, partial [Pseudomonadota bacterium]